MHKLVATLLVTCVVGGCGVSLKQVLRTIDDVATGACMVFAQSNPDEFKNYVLAVAPAEGEKHGFDPRWLCEIKKVVQPFIDEQLALQRSMKASLSGSTDAVPAD